MKFWPSSKRFNKKHSVCTSFILSIPLCRTASINNEASFITLSLVSPQSYSLCHLIFFRRINSSRIRPSASRFILLSNPRFAQIWKNLCPTVPTMKRRSSIFFGRTLSIRMSFCWNGHFSNALKNDQDITILIFLRPSNNSEAIFIYLTEALSIV